MMSLDPLLIRWRQHAIVGILLHNHFDCGLSIGWVSCAHSCLLLEDACEPLAPEWRLAIQRSNWWSQLRINDNVFGIRHIKLRKSNYKLEYSKRFDYILFQL